MQNILYTPSEDEVERQFYTALFDPDLEVPLGLTTWNGSDPAKRFAVYRNNVMVSLIEALGDNFPTIRIQVGGDFFDAMAAHYIRQSPPASPVLAFYGEAMPAFLELFPPLSDYPWLSDLARVDLAFTRAWHAEDPSEGEQWTLSPSVDISNLSVNLHPSLQLLSSQWAIYSLWMREREGQTYQVDPDQPECMILFRPSLEVMAHCLSKAEYTFITGLQQGKTLGEATESTLEQYADFDLENTLRLLVNQRIIIQFLSHKAEY